jgi:cytoskeletal protein CcmA (bactofilin family)
MFSRSSRTPIQTETLATLIDASVSITGEVRFEKSARIDGTVAGDVMGSKTKGGTLIVGATAVIKGNVTCHSVVVLGRIEGDIDSSQLEIRSGATLLGDIYYDVIEIHQGSSINGRMVRREGADPKSVLATSPTESTTGNGPAPG